MKQQSLILNFVFIDLLVVSFMIIVYFTDTPVALEKKRGKYGAIAIRDNVIAFQKFGTCLFTENYLIRNYTESYYFTEGNNYSCHEQFVKKLDALLTNNDTVDLYLLAHTNFYYKWVEEIDSTKRKRINLVYNTGCSGLLQDSKWKKLGVAKYVAHRSNQSISPVFYFYFLKRYLSNDDVLNAVFDSNMQMMEKLNRLETFSFGAIKVDQRVIEESQGTLRDHK